MRDHKLCFYGEIWLIIPKLSLSPMFILSTDNSSVSLQLFDLIAESIFKFMKDHNLMDKNLPLGFTFSFPCRQEGLDRAILTQWTKGFKCEGVEGNNIVQLLHEAIERRGVRLNLCF